VLESSTKHAAKHTRRAPEIDPEDAMVRLSDEAKRRFKELYDATSDDRYTFNSRTHATIGGFAQVPEFSLKLFVQELPKIVQDTETWAAVRGDGKARDALKGVLEALAEDKGFMLVGNLRGAQREAQA
jgi:hypothetical protein